MDANGLSRRPRQVVELFPEAVKAICEAHTVRRNNCPYIEALIVSSHSLSVETEDLPSVSTQFRDVDWSREQLADSSISRVIELLEFGFCPEKHELKTESPEVMKYMRKSKKFSLLIEFYTEILC